MPLITPPTDEEPEPEEPPVVETDYATQLFRDRWIKWFLDCPNWICTICKSTNFGRNKYCAGCYGRQGIKTTLRPDSYQETTYADYYFGGKQ